MRDDLIWFRHGTRRLDRWTLQDPSNGEFYYFTSVEKDVMQWFRGDRNLSEIFQALQNEKPGNDWSLEKLFAFLQILLFHNLVLCDQFGKGQTLAMQVERKKYQTRFGWLWQPLSIRIPLFRPTWILEVLRPVESCLFHPAIIVLVLFTAMLTMAVALVNWNEISATLPSIESLVRGDRIVLLMLALGIVKSLHELGHAMACRRYAGKCGEIGLMFLVFTPCLYCDVSPSWKVQERWQRVVIALAGIYVELILATAAFVSLIIFPSEVIRAFAIYIFGVCTVSTIFLNGNPLVRYDGYFALSDFLETPNLMEQAREAANSSWAQIFLKSPVRSSPLDCSQTFLVAYWVLATIYRWLLLVMVLWGVHWLLRPLGLQFVAYYVAALAAMGIALSWIRSLRRFPEMVQVSGGVKWVNSLVSIGLLLGLVAFIVILPVPDSVKGRAVIRFRDMTPVFVQQPGNLVQGIDTERSVQAGEIVFTLDSVDRKVRELQLAEEVNVTATKVQLRKELATIDTQTDLQLPALERSLDVRKAQLKAVEEEEEQLTYRAPMAGYWFHALVNHRAPSRGSSLARWSGFPLESCNQGAYFEKGLLLGWIVKRDKPIIEAFLREAELPGLAVGSPVSIRFDHEAKTTLEGKIESIGTEPIPYLPIELGGDWHVMAQQDTNGMWKPETAMFRVVIALESSPTDLPLGGRATVQFQLPPATIASQIYRFVNQTVFYQRQQQAD